MCIIIICQIIILNAALIWMYISHVTDLIVNNSALLRFNADQFYFNITVRNKISE